MSVIGAGPLGRRLAALSCRAGYITTLEDVLPSNLRKARLELESLPADLLFASTVPDAVRDADLVLDSMPDELESKLEIFSMVDRMAPPRTAMLTPTAIHSIADLAACTYRADRCFSFAVPEGLIVGRAERGTVRMTETQATLPEVREQVLRFWERAGWTAELRVDAGVVPSATIR